MKNSKRFFAFMLAMVLGFSRIVYAGSNVYFDTHDVIAVDDYAMYASELGENGYELYYPSTELEIDESYPKAPDAEDSETGTNYPETPDVDDPETEEVYPETPDEEWLGETSDEEDEEMDEAESKENEQEQAVRAERPVINLNEVDWDELMIEAFSAGICPHAMMCGCPLIGDGTIGTGGAPWRMFNCNVLVVDEGTIANTNPWWQYRARIERIIFAGSINAGTSLASMFSNFPNLYYIWGLQNLDTSNVTNMSSTFNWSPSLTILDLSSWDTRNVTTMSGMFSNATGLSVLNMAGWNTGNVTNMSSMFSNASRLTNLNISTWNTSNVTNMNAMFNNASNLNSLNLSGWNTSRVTNMNGLFAGTFALSELTLGRNFRFIGTTASLPTIQANNFFTGRWRNVRLGNVGTASNPRGAYSLTSMQLMSQFDGNRLADTWVWETTNEVLLASLWQPNSTPALAPPAVMPMTSGLFMAQSNLSAWDNNRQIVLGRAGRTPVNIAHQSLTQGNTAASGWKPIRTYGINNATAYQIRIRTTGYENIRLTARMVATGSGPNIWTLAYSTSPTGPFTRITVPGSTTTNRQAPSAAFRTDTYADFSWAQSMAFNNILLPASIANQNAIYLRIVYDGTIVNRNGNIGLNHVTITGTSR